MVVLKIQAKGLFNFKDLLVDLSYPKKISKSTIDSEHLDGYPNFRYKKAVILVGSNATGKTCLGRLIYNVSQYVNTGHEDYITKMAKGNASIDLFLVNDMPILFRLSVKLHNGHLSTSLYESKIGIKDSFENSEAGLKATIDNDIKAIKNRVGVLNCQFAYPEISNKLDITEENRDAFLKTLKCVIGTLDPTLKDVVISKEIDNSFIIKRGSDNIIIQDGKLLNKEVLSSGTIEGIDVALFIASMTSGVNKMYYCDEHFSFIHSDIEKRIFSIMVGKLKANEQLFFTTHNMDMLDLNVPKHTFAFFKRDVNNNPSIVFADSLLKRNTDSVKCAFENDLFESSPDLALLNELEAESNE